MAFIVSHNPVGLCRYRANLLLERTFFEEQIFLLLHTLQCICYALAIGRVCFSAVINMPLLNILASTANRACRILKQYLLFLWCHQAE